MENFNGLLLKKIRNKETKEKFILYLLKQKWHKIVGNVAANHTTPTKLNEGLLFLNTDNPAWSHNLLMLKRQVLTKIAEFIPLEPGRVKAYKIKDIRFYNGRVEDVLKIEHKSESFMPKLTTNLCPVCGVKLILGETLCHSCERKQKNDLRSQIHKILCEAPWYDYKDCVKHLKCDRILFMGVKDNMRRNAVDRALDVQATDKDKYFALMLSLGKKPEEITDELLKKTLRNWKRSKEYVPAPRKQLSSEK